MTKEEFIKDRFDIETLTGLGFFKAGDSITVIEKKICKYFDLKNVFMYDHIMDDKSETVKADIETFSIN